MKNAPSLPATVVFQIVGVRAELSCLLIILGALTFSEYDNLVNHSSSDLLCGRCEHRQFSDTTHLILWNLDEFEIGYLRALLHNDVDIISRYEEDAQYLGYGPLIACSYAAPSSS